MNLPPESGQAGRSSTSSMNGRSWLQIPMGAYLGSDWLSETDRICLISTYAEDEWFRHRNIGVIKVTDFCGIPGARDGYVFCIG